MSLLQINKEHNECLHCGKGIGEYCEKCYQDLITINARKQTRIAELETLIFIYRDSDSMSNHVPRMD